MTAEVSCERMGVWVFGSSLCHPRDFPVISHPCPLMVVEQETCSRASVVSSLKCDGNYT